MDRPNADERDSPCTSKDSAAKKSTVDSDDAHPEPGLAEAHSRTYEVIADDLLPIEKLKKVYELVGHFATRIRYEGSSTRPLLSVLNAFRVDIKLASAYLVETERAIMIEPMSGAEIRAENAKRIGTSETQISVHSSVATKTSALLERLGEFVAKLRQYAEVYEVDAVTKEIVKLEVGMKLLGIESCEEGEQTSFRIMSKEEIREENHRRRLDKRSKATTATVRSGEGRKRAIRGGGPLGEEEAIVFRGHNNTTTSQTPPIVPSVPPLTFQLPKATPTFWNTASKGKSEEKKGEEGATVEEKKPVFGSFGSISASSSSQSQNRDKKVVPLLGSLTSSSTLPFTTTARAPPAFTGFSFASKTTTPLSFGPSSEKTAETAPEGETEGAEEEEYVPPKVEVVENVEPDAAFSVKCACHKLANNEYIKLGVGMLHLKDNGGRKSILVRAATTTGKIWINARMDATMKASKAKGAEDKITIMTPIAAKEVGVFLLKVPSKADADKILEQLKAAGVKV